ncbi:MAG: hypothetical protein Kow0027_25590 [Saprospiraceae bacterium]
MTSSGTVNSIENFEQAFHFENTDLKVSGFDIYALQDYYDVQGLPNNPSGDAGIGIDFRRAISGVSSLEIDNVNFHDFSSLNTYNVAVRDYISKGKHTLKAIASQPLNSIKTSNIAGAYDLLVEGQARLNAQITANDISTNGGPNFGFGITGNIHSKNNIVNVEDSRFSINSNSTSMLNGGVVLSSPAEIDQRYKITADTIDVYLPDGAGIGITNAFNSIVRRNTLTNGVDIPGIYLDEGGKGLVDCNNIRNKTIGVDIKASEANRYAANYLRGNNRDMEFTGNSAGAQGSEIKWNTFRGSDLQSIWYYDGAIAGPQLHNHYNQWRAQFGNEVEYEINTNSPLNNQFYHPKDHPVGTIMHPASNPPALFIPNDPDAPIDTVPSYNFCTAAYDMLSAPEDTIPDAKLTWEGIVEDTAFWSGLTAAEQTFMQQEIYGLLLEHSDWMSGSTSLSGFKSAHDNGFVGRSETLKQNWQALLDDISQHQSANESLENSLDSLSALAQQWIALMNGDTTQMDSLLALLTPVVAEGDSLARLIQESDSLFFLAVKDSVAQLLVQNNALSESEWYQWFEKRYNEIALNWMAGTEPDSTAAADLRTIAQTCLSDGGRAVLSARGLCSTWLKEHYGENGCQSAPEGRSAQEDAPGGTAVSGLHIVPNPANDLVRIQVEKPENQQGMELRISGMDGRQMYQGVLPAGSTELTLSVSNWPQGLYVARIFDGAQVLTRTFVIQHR